MMELLVMMLSFLGTLAGAFGGIVTSSKLTNYRVRQLEKKVDKHNESVARLPVVERDIQIINHRVRNLEGRVI